MKILIVDDDQGIREFVRGEIAKKGHEVMTAFGAEMALIILKENGNGDIGLVISDVSMPPGESGLELFRKTKRLRPEIRFWLMTGDWTLVQHLRDETRGMGIEKILHKGHDSFLDDLERFEPGPAKSAP